MVEKHKNVVKKRIIKSVIKNENGKRFGVQVENQKIAINPSNLITKDGISHVHNNSLYVCMYVHNSFRLVKNLGSTSKLKHFIMISSKNVVIINIVNQRQIFNHNR